MPSKEEPAIEVTEENVDMPYVRNAVHCRFPDSVERMLDEFASRS
jgi:hypothetical protein